MKRRLNYGPICEQDSRKTNIPVVAVVEDEPLEGFFHRAIEPFDETVRLGMMRCREFTRDSEMFSQLFHRFVHEMAAAIRLQNDRTSVPIDDVLVENLAVIAAVSSIVARASAHLVR